MGDPKPQPQQETTANVLQSLQYGLPGLMKTINAELLPAALANYGANAAVSPGYANLNLDIYRNTAPALNAIGNEISAMNAEAQAARDLNVLRGTGGDLLRAYTDATRVVDPEYYDVRAKTGARIGQRLDQGLSGAELQEIERFLARDAARTGNLNQNSNLKTVSNALTVGREGRNALDTAINEAISFLSTGARTGADAFQIATGRPSQANSGESKFLGAQNVPNPATDVANNLLSSATSMSNTAATLAANRQSGFDKAITAMSGY
jgi:hypothetical protein